MKIETDEKLKKGKRKKERRWFLKKEIERVWKMIKLKGKERKNPK